MHAKLLLLLLAYRGLLCVCVYVSSTFTTNINYENETKD